MPNPAIWSDEKIEEAENISSCFPLGILDSAIACIKAQREEAAAVLKSIPEKYRVIVRESNGPESVWASLAVSVAKMNKEVDSYLIVWQNQKRQLEERDETIRQQQAEIKELRELLGDEVSMSGASFDPEVVPCEQSISEQISLIGRTYRETIRQQQAEIERLKAIILDADTALELAGVHDLLMGAEYKEYANLKEKVNNEVKAILDGRM